MSEMKCGLCGEKWFLCSGCGAEFHRDYGDGNAEVHRNYGWDKKLSDEKPGLERFDGTYFEKAYFDNEWDYLLFMRGGEYLRVTGLNFVSEHVVRVQLLEVCGEPFEYPCPRGVDILMSEILGIADAPKGS